MKIVTIIESVVGKAMSLIFGFCMVMAANDIFLGSDRPVFDIIMYAALTIVGTILVKISFKTGDTVFSDSSYIKVRYLINKLLYVLITIVGVILIFVAIAYPVGNLFNSLFEYNVIPFVSDVPLNIEYLYLVASITFVSIIWEKKYYKYILKHCKCCGKSLNGAAYEYEEVERSFNPNGGSPIRTSKIRFCFTCPHCYSSNVSYKNMNTNAEEVERYANSVVN